MLWRLIVAFKNKMLVCWYQVLGCPFGAPIAQVRSAYLRLARRFHPDSAEGKDNEEKFIQIQKAYQVLSDPKSKENYDKNAKVMSENTFMNERVELVEFEQLTQNVVTASDFFKAVNDAMKQVADEENRWSITDNVMSFMDFGTDETHIKDVQEFYKRANSFQTSVSFLWLNVDANIDEINNRAERRYVIAENKKNREEARKTRNKGFKEFLQTVKETDPRVARFKEEKLRIAEEKRLKEKERVREERLRSIQEAEALQQQNDDVGLQEAMEQISTFEFVKKKSSTGEKYTCKVCNKLLLVANQASHEITKAHKHNENMNKKKKKNKSNAVGYGVH